MYRVNDFNGTRRECSRVERRVVTAATCYCDRAAGVTQPFHGTPRVSAYVRAYAYTSPCTNACTLALRAPNMGEKSTN